MATISAYETAAGKRYRVRFRKPDNSQTDKRGFLTKKEAALFAASLEVSKAKGEFVDATAARATVSALGVPWLASQTHLKPSSLRPVEVAWRVHVQPTWGSRAVGTIRHSEVQAWVSNLTSTRGATTVLRAYGVLASILDAAVKDRRLSTNPARGVNLPRKSKKPHVYLSHEQVQLLAEQSTNGALVRFLAYTGLRWGEASGLRIKHVDTRKRRVSIEENAVLVGGVVVVGTPKTHNLRSVPYPEFLTLPLAQLSQGKPPEALLFGDGASHMRLPNSDNSWFAGAVVRAQSRDATFPRVTPHDLRHTAASLAISAGANVKAVQRMLGHASAAMTLDTYADLFEDDLDAVAVALNHARALSSVGKVWANADFEITKTA